MSLDDAPARQPGDPPHLADDAGRPAPSWRRTLRSFSYAGAGLAYLLRTQPNFRVHVAATVLAIGAAIGLGTSAAETAAVLLSIGLVLVAEAMNTAVEAVVDLASPGLHPLAKTAKDVAAAGVLIAAGVAVSVGSIVFVPRLVRLLS